MTFLSHEPAVNLMNACICILCRHHTLESQCISIIEHILIYFPHSHSLNMLKTKTQSNSWYVIWFMQEQLNGRKVQLSGFIWCIRALFLAAKWHFKEILPKLFSLHSILQCLLVLEACFNQCCCCVFLRAAAVLNRRGCSVSHPIQFAGASHASQTPARFPAAAEAGNIKGGAMQQRLSPLAHSPCRETHDREPRSHEKSREEEKEEAPLTPIRGWWGEGRMKVLALHSSSTATKAVSRFSC